jgi:uncharacterized protein (DUF1684 family)
VWWPAAWIDFYLSYENPCIFDFQFSGSLPPNLSMTCSVSSDAVS